MKPEHKQHIALLSGILEAAMETLAGAISGNQEVVLHNLTEPERSVQKIINGHVSGRVQGDSLLSGPDKDAGFAALLIKEKQSNRPVIIKDYRTTAASGKILDSASVIFYADNGEPLMAFCINVDRSPYEQIRMQLDTLATTIAENDESEDMHFGDVIERAIQDIIAKHTVAHRKIQKDQRLKIVAEMHARGIFKMKGGIQHAAQILGVTRYTIYNDLEKLDEK